jgi:hypothetical protein
MDFFEKIRSRPNDESDVSDYKVLENIYDLCCQWYIDEEKLEDKIEFLKHHNYLHEGLFFQQELDVRKEMFRKLQRTLQIVF